jgi:hypothetical protein
MFASLPEARTVDLKVEGSNDFPTHDGPNPVVGIGLFSFLEALMKMDLALYQALMSINVPEPKVNAVIEAWESDLNTLLATKADVSGLRSDVIAQIKTEASQLEVRLTIRMGMIVSAFAGIIIAAIKLIQ